MEPLGQDYNCEKGKMPEVNIWEHPETCIYVNFGPKNKLSLASFYIRDKTDLIALKNRFNWAFEQFMRESR